MTEVRGRLEQSLHNSVWLALGLERQDYQVQRPWSATVSQGAKRAVPLEAGTRIVEVFDRPDLQKQLLILGEPGAGKTTMMLELAEDLGRRAGADNGQPIPVLVSLSSWKDPKQSIFEWLVGELKAKYGLRVELGREWLRLGRLLPLLDGLDEVATERQRDCAVALNAWLTGDVEQRPCGVLICCRREEFEQVVREPLSLYGAIYLQALTDGQIEDYFVRFGLGDVWETLREDEALRELLMTPLFLSMFGLVQVQGTFDLAGWQARETSERKIEYLFDMYWEAAMSRKLIVDPNDRRLSKTYGIKVVPSLKAVQRSLIFAARGMQEESNEMLLIESVQRSWLHKIGDSISYSLICGIIHSFLGSVLSEILISIFGFADSLPNIPFAAFLVGLCHSYGSIQYVDALNFSFPPKISPDGGLFGRLFAVIFILTIPQNINFNLPPMQLISLSFVFIFSLILGARSDVEERLTPNQGIKGSMRSSLILLTMILALYYLIHICVDIYLPNVFSDNKNLGRQCNLLLYFFLIMIIREVGGNAVIQHVALRIVLYFNRYAPLRYDLLLNYCTERLLLQRIGGRYRFMHKTLQDYFAKQEL